MTCTVTPHTTVGKQAPHLRRHQRRRTHSTPSKNKTPHTPTSSQYKPTAEVTKAVCFSSERELSDSGPTLSILLVKHHLIVLQTPLHLVLDVSREGLPVLECSSNRFLIPPCPGLFDGSVILWHAVSPALGRVTTVQRGRTFAKPFGAKNSRCC